MKIVHYILLAVAALSLPLSRTAADHQSVIDDFSESVDQRFPRGWRTFPFQGRKARAVYRVQTEAENRYLAADDTINASTQIFKKFNWDLNEHPKFSWRWRARILPKGADESNSATNDSACGIYILFSQVDRQAIKYTWSSTLPIGSINQKSGHQMFFVAKESGERRLNEWRSHTINLKADFERLFDGEKLRPVIGIGILTDGNAVNQPAACDYDDFVKHQ